MKTAKNAAIFMIMLIITLPFYTAGVFADSVVVNPSLVDKDGKKIGAIKKGTPEWIVNVGILPQPARGLEYEREIDGKTVKFNLNEDVVIRKDGVDVPFAQCTKQDARYICTYISGDVSSSSQNYEICSAPEKQGCSACPSENPCRKTFSLNIDSAEPQVISFSINPAQLLADDASAEYRVQDTLTGSGDRCSGLEKLDIVSVENGAEKQIAASILLDTTSCLAEETKPVKITLPRGNYILCPKLYDKAGFSKLDISKCIEIVKETEAKGTSDVASITLIKLTDAEGNDIEYLSGNEIEVHAEFSMISLFGFKRAAVESSALGISSDMLCKAKEGSKAESYACNYPGKVSASKTETTGIKITVYDNNDRTSEKIQEFSLDVDKDAPKVNEIRTSFARLVDGKEKYYMSSVRKNSIEAAIIESGSGFNNNNVGFDINGVVEKATECSIGSSSAEEGQQNEAANEWICRVDDIISVPSASGSAHITVEGTDDAGNKISSDGASADIPFDAKAPELKGLVIESDESSSFFGTGDSVTVTAYIKDAESGLIGSDGNNNLYISSPLSEDSEAAAVGCEPTLLEEPVSDEAGEDTADAGGNTGTPIETGEEEGLPIMPPGLAASSDLYRCLWNPSSLSKTGALSLELNLGDVAGNAFKKTEEKFYIIYTDNKKRVISEAPLSVAVKSYEKEGKTKKDRWSAVLSGQIPESINSKTLIALANGRNVWFAIDLTKKNSNARLLDMKIEGCEIANVASDFFTETGILRPSLKSVKQTLALRIRQIDIAEDFKEQLKYKDNNAFLPFTCKLVIYSELNSQISSEEEALAGELVFSELEELDAAVRKKVDAVKNSWLVQGKWIATFDGIFRIGKNLCNVLTMLTYAEYIIKIVSGSFLWCDNNPICLGLDKPLQATDYSVSKITKMSWLGYPYVACQFITCSKTLWGEWLYGGQSALGMIMRGNAVDISKFDTNTDFKKFGGVGPALNQQLGKITDGVFKARQADPGALAGAGPVAKSIFGEFNSWGNPYGSMILSIVTGCIPGIFYNLQKARMIECRYVTCIEQKVSAGIPLQYCEQERAFAFCEAFYGELFQIIPFAGFVKGFLSQFMNLITNPFALFGAAYGLGCELIPSWTGQWFCKWPNVALYGKKIYDIGKSMFSEGAWSLDSQECDDILSAMDEEKQQDEERDMGREENRGGASSSSVSTGSSGSSSGAAGSSGATSSGTANPASV